MARFLTSRLAGAALTTVCVLTLLFVLQPCCPNSIVVHVSSEISDLLIQAQGEPIADAGPDMKVTAGDRVRFDGTGSTDDVGITNYTWNFTYDGEEQTLFDARPEFQFSVPGTYEVTLNVTDSEGNFDTDTVKVVVEKNFLMKYWPVLLITALVALVIAQFYLIGRRKE